MPETQPKKSIGTWHVTLVTGMASYIDSAAIVSSGTALVIYQTALGLSPGQIGVLSSLLTICIAVGAVIGGRLGDVFGRRNVFVATMFIIATGGAALVFAPSFAVLAVGMALVGIGTGADLPVSLATIAEACDDTNRGKMLGFTQILWTLGILASQAFGAVVGDLGRLGGQIMFAHIAVVAIVLVPLRLVIPESTHWTQAHDDKESGGHHAAVNRVRVRDVFRKPYLVPLAALLVFYPLTNLAANTNGQFGAYLFVSVAGMPVTTYSQIGMGLTLLGILFTFGFMRIADGPHRIAWFAFGALCGVAGFATPALFGVVIPTLLVQVFMMQIFGAFAFEPILKVWAQENFPTLVRTTVQGLIIAVARVLAAALALVTPVILEIGPRALFTFLTAVIAVGTGTAYFAFRNRPHNQFLHEPAESAGVEHPHEDDRRETPRQARRVDGKERI